MRLGASSTFQKGTRIICAGLDVSQAPSYISGCKVPPPRRILELKQHLLPGRSQASTGDCFCSSCPARAMQGLGSPEGWRPHPQLRTVWLLGTTAQFLFSPSRGRALLPTSGFPWTTPGSPFPVGTMVQSNSSLGASGHTLRFW